MEQRKIKIPLVLVIAIVMVAVAFICFFTNRKEKTDELDINSPIEYSNQYVDTSSDEDTITYSDSNSSSKYSFDSSTSSTNKTNIKSSNTSGGISIN